MYKDSKLQTSNKRLREKYKDNKTQKEMDQLTEQLQELKK